MIHHDKEIVKASYGEKVEFSKDIVLQYTDFSLEFIRAREISMPDSKIKLWMMDFVATRDGEEAKISYGTGLLYRKEFEMRSKTFYLEIIYSQKFGDMGENEVVVSDKDPDRNFAKPQT